jgi:hypothetical protein
MAQVEFFRHEVTLAEGDVVTWTWNTQPDGYHLVGWWLEVTSGNATANPRNLTTDGYVNAAAAVGPLVLDIINQDQDAQSTVVVHIQAADATAETVV